MASLNKNIALAVATLLACGSAAASEAYDLRYAPGYGAADMSAPFEGGFVFQTHAYIYSGNIRTTSKTDISSELGSSLANTGVLFANVNTNTQINVRGLLPRLSYMSGVTFLGATLGGTALLPIIQKQSNITVNGASLSGVAQGLVTGDTRTAALSQIESQGQAVAAANSDKSTGIGDLEFSPILRWSTDATQTLFIMTVCAPTGKYDKNLAANPSEGKYWTFRPAVQWSFIGDGWDFGSRVAYSYNTRSTATKYKTGSYMNLDFALMKSISDSTRIGLAGYAVKQFAKDSTSLKSDADYAAQFGAANAAFAEAREAATLGQKGRVIGFGPEVAYIHGAGDFMLEGRLLKEADTQTRPKGFTAVVALSKPF